MSEENEETTEETTDEAVTAEETPVEEAPAAEAPAAEETPEPEEDPLADLPWKERRRVLKSRQSGPAGPERTPEERQAEREKARAAKARARRKRRAEEKAERAGRERGTGTPSVERVRTGKPKTRQGVVVSDKTDKTITVQIDTARRHKIYEKIVRQSHKIHVHDERNEASEGDVVRVVETRKLSKTKHWRLIEIVEKAR